MSMAIKISSFVYLPISEIFLRINKIIFKAIHTENVHAEVTCSF